jgi:hypothetical protein
MIAYLFIKNLREEQALDIHGRNEEGGANREDHGFSHVEVTSTGGRLGATKS